jgi:hypothetical protein
MRATSSADSPERMRAWMSRGASEAESSGGEGVAGRPVGAQHGRDAVVDRQREQAPTSSASTSAWPSSERATKRTGRILRRLPSNRQPRPSERLATRYASAPGWEIGTPKTDDSPTSNPPTRVYPGAQTRGGSVSVTVRPLESTDGHEGPRHLRRGDQGPNATFETNVPTWSEWQKAHLPAHRFVAVKTARSSSAGRAVALLRAARVRRRRRVLHVRPGRRHRSGVGTDCWTR